MIDAMQWNCFVASPILSEVYISIEISYISHSKCCQYVLLTILFGYVSTFKKQFCWRTFQRPSVCPVDNLIRLCIYLQKINFPRLIFRTLQANGFRGSDLTKDFAVTVRNKYSEHDFVVCRIILNKSSTLVFYVQDKMIDEGN